MKRPFKYYHGPLLIFRSRIPINIDRSLNFIQEYFLKEKKKGFTNSTEKKSPGPDPNLATYSSHRDCRGPLIIHLRKIHFEFRA